MYCEKPRNTIIIFRNISVYFSCSETKMFNVMRVMNMDQSVSNDIHTCVVIKSYFVQKRLLVVEFAFVDRCVLIVAYPFIDCETTSVTILIIFSRSLSDESIGSRGPHIRVCTAITLELSMSPMDTISIRL